MLEDDGAGPAVPSKQDIALAQDTSATGIRGPPVADRANSPECRGPSAVAPLNVVLISDAVAQAEQIQEAAAPDTIAMIYDSDAVTRTEMVDLLASVSAGHNGAPIGHLGIVAHGRPGELDLGKGDDLSLAMMPSQAAALERLRSVLTSDARLDLYSCSVAAGASGRSFVDELAAVTGAAVFASDNPVGTVPGADFVWEYHTGQAAASNELFSVQEIETIPGLCLPTVPQFSQQDPAWANDPMIDQLGVTQGTIKQYGCAMTCTAMLARYYGADTDPKQMNAWLNSHQGYSAGSAALYWAKPADYTGGLMTYEDSFRWTSQPPYSDNDHWSDLKAQLDQGYPVIVEVDAIPSTSALDNHWVLVTGFLGGSTASPSSYAINDPWDGTTSTLAKYYDATYDNTFFAIRVYHGVVPSATTYSVSPNPATVSEGAGTLSFTVTRSGGLPAETLFATTLQTEGSTNNGDYTGLVNQNAVFASNQTQAMVTVSIANDTVVESNETFALIVQRNATDPNSTYLAKSTFTIIDDDTQPTTHTISPNPATVNEGAGTLTFTVNRSGGLPAETIYASTTQTEGNANSGDYTGIVGRSVAFASNQTQATVAVSITNDTTVESNETFGFIVQRNLSDPISVYLAKSTFTIIDDDTQPTNYVLGVDVSKYNTVSDWNGVKNATPARAFVYVRATGATGYNDPNFTTYISGAESAGLVAGPYHFAYPEYNSALAEAQHFITVAGAYVSPGKLRPMLDIEDDPANNSYPSRMGDASLANWISDWETDVEQLSGVEANPILYTTRSYAAALAPYLKNTTSLWIAVAGGTTQYSAPQVPAPSAAGWDEGVWPWVIEQYNTTDSGPPGDWDVLNPAMTLASLRIAGTALPQLSIATPAAITEGDTGTKNLTFTVSLSASSSQMVTVNYATSNGTATAGSDYTFTSGTLNWAPRDTSAKTINVPVNGDTTVEPDETFYVTLSNASNATLSASQGVGTIQNDDMADNGWRSPTAAGRRDNYWTNPQNAYVSDDAYAVANSWYLAQDWYNFGFDIPANAIIQGIEIRIEGTGNGDDYVGKVKCRVFAGGFAFKETPYLEFPVAQDSIQTVGSPSDLWGRPSWSPSDFGSGSDTPFCVSLTTGAEWYTARVDQIQAKVYYTEPASVPEIEVRGNGAVIADGDTSPSADDHTDFGSVVQGQAGPTRTFTVTNTGQGTLTLGSLNPPPGFTVTEGLTTSLVQGASDTFTVRLDSTTVGPKSGDIAFTNNDSDENPFNFRITGIVQEPAVPQVVISVSPSSVMEDGSTNLVYTFVRSAPSSSALAVSFSVGGTALFGTDYTQNGADSFTTTSGVVTIPVGSATATVTIDPMADSVVEPNVTVSLTVASGTGYTPGTPLAASGTIRDDDDTGSDGIPATEEQGPGGNDPDYDGNVDGIPDGQQDNVASFHTVTDDYVTLGCSAGMNLSDVAAVANPSPESIPQGVQIPYGAFEFSVNNVGVGGSTTVTLFLPSGATPNIYYKYGPTPDDPSEHWYAFMYDGHTGAEISGNVVTLHFADGLRGDDDLLANGTIADAGSPAVADQPARAPVYRFWKASDNTHFFTIKESEKQKLIDYYSNIYTYEGVGYYAYVKDQPPAGTLPVYRFWKASDDTHFFTIKEGERDKLINNYSNVYTYEGIAYYAYAVGQQPVGTLPVYRFWKSANNTHFFTIKESEKDKLINLYFQVYTFEGIGWYSYVG